MHGPSRLFVTSILVLALALAGCPPKKDAPKTDKTAEPVATSTQAALELPPGDGPVATVNGVPIPRLPFNKEYKLTIERYQKAKHDVQPALRERLKDNIVRRLVDAELIRQQAEKLGVTITPEERASQWEEHKKRYGTEEAFNQFLSRAGTTADDVKEQFEQNLLREKVFAKISEGVSVPAAEVKEFFDKNQPRYEEPEQVQASHILIRTSQNASDAEKAEKKKKAEGVLKKAKAKPAMFAELAKEFGEDPTKDRGGELGYFTKGRMVKPFEDAVWTMKVGQVSSIVETQFGYHIIKKTDYKAARKKPFKEVEDQIRKSLEAKKKNDAIRDALTKWKNEAKIEIFVKGDEKIMNAAQPQISPFNPNSNINAKMLEGNQLRIQKVPPGQTNDNPTQQPGNAPSPNPAPAH
jgi:peptidyl-prolyl cis-trans isomerase C